MSVQGSFDPDSFVADCAAAATETDAQGAVREVLRRAVREPGRVLAALGEPRTAALTLLHRSDTLTIFSATWTPRLTLMPHNHELWALIGLYAGREDNLFWERSEQGVRAVGAEALFAGDVCTMPSTAIHSVTNPLDRFTGGLHLYGGDYFATPRSLWDPETREEQPSDGDRIAEYFERENERWRRSSGEESPTRATPA